jgi:hypothetical protein
LLLAVAAVTSEKNTLAVAVVLVDYAQQSQQLAAADRLNRHSNY